MSATNGKRYVYGASRDPAILSTGQVAAILHCSPRYASKLIDKGLIEGCWRMESGDRRVPLEAVRRYCVERGMPLDGVQERQVLLVGFRQPVALCLVHDVAARGQDTIVASDALEAVWSVAKGSAASWVVVVDVGSCGREQSLGLAHLLRSRVPNCRCIGVLPEDARVQVMENYDAVLTDAEQVEAIL